MRSLSKNMRRKSYAPFGVTALILLIGSGLLFVFWSGNVIYPEALRPTQTPHPDLATGSIIVSDKDGMVMLFVPAGDFVMGMSQGASNERPEHVVYLDAYWIDKTEVTNEMYTQCVDEGWCTPPQNRSSATRPSYYGNPDFDDYPVIHVDWYRAGEYCKWAGRRLPTEAEWEKAARGTQGQDYPWGNQQPNGDLLNFNDESGDTAPVGNYPEGASPYLALDMAGNVFEWVSDCFGSMDYRFSPRQNPTGPSNCDHQHRVIRGGYSWQVAPHMSPGIGDRLNNIETATSSDLGFRCAISASTDDSTAPAYQGRYFGQAIPSLSLEPFAPEIFSPEGQFGLLLHSSIYFSPDGKMVFFANQRHDNYDLVPMIIRQQDHGNWGIPQVVQPPVNADTISWIPSPKGDFKLYAYTDQLPLIGTTKEQAYSLWLVDWTGNGWSSPYLPLDLAQENCSLYFNTPLAGGMGREDIFVLEYPISVSLKPVNIGTPINTEAEEYIVFIPEDERYLIFYRYDEFNSRNRGLFVSVYDDVLGSWDIPTSLDLLLGFTKTGLDVSISPDGQFLFFLERNRGIYWIAKTAFDRLILD